MVKGYDEATRELIQDDSLQGANLRYAYDDFSALWQAFNYEYVVLVPVGKVTTVKLVLGQDADEKYARFNLSVAHAYVMVSDRAYTGVLRAGRL